MNSVLKSKRDGSIWRSLCAIVALAAPLLLAAPAQASDALWLEYDEAQEAYDAAVAECEERGFESTSGDRACRDAARAGARLVDALGTLLQNEEDLFGEDREVAIDAWLTYRQHVGSLLTDVRECNVSLESLNALLDEPTLASRPLLQQATVTARDEAQTCVDQAAALNAVPTEPRATRDRSGAKPWGWILAGSGVAIAGAGIGIAAGPMRQANNDIACWNESCPTAGTRAEAEDAEGRRDSLNTTASTLVGVGAIAVIGGVTWALLDRKAAGRDQLVTGWMDGQSAGVLWSARF